MDWSLRGGRSSEDEADEQSRSGLFGRRRENPDGRDNADTEATTAGSRLRRDAGAGGRGASARDASSTDGPSLVRRVRDRIDPRDAKAAAESATKGVLLIGVRLAGAVLIAYGLYVLLLVDGWTQLGAGLAVAGVVPAYAPGAVIGLGELLWKLFRLA
jgi:hypothetical protein